MLDDNKRLDLEILFLDMFEKCPTKERAERLYEHIVEILDYAFEGISEDKEWE